LLLTATLCGLISAVTVWEVNAVATEPFQQTRFQQLVGSRVILVRGIHFLGALDYLTHRPLWLNLSGEGQMPYETNVARNLGVPVVEAAAEVDWIDLVGGYGLLFMVLVYGFYWGCFKRTRLLRLAYGRSVQLVVSITLSWFLIHSVLAGHAMTTVMAAGTLAPLLAYVLHLDSASVRRVTTTASAKAANSTS
jgi:hypothetical protein